jgi:ribosomal-protein-alanine N-acetyltransferase
VEQQLGRWIERWRESGFGTWTVFERTTQEGVGRIEFDPIGPGWRGAASDEIELGCVVHPSVWGQGIATEATELAVTDFFERVGRSRLLAMTTIENDRSQRVLEKLGMRHCGQTKHVSETTLYELFELSRESTAT